MADDKPKKPADRSPEGVVKTLEICNLLTDPSSRHISAALIADNLANGAKTVDELTRNVRGISANVGQCVANAYEDKKPGIGERVTSYFNSVVASASEVGANVKTMAGMIAEPLVMGSVSTVTNGTPETLKARPAQINRASSPDAAPGS